MNNKLEFKDISDEQYRVYEWAGYSKIRINEPLQLNVSESGGHRILDKEGTSHYIPKGWLHLYWVVKEGKPTFAF